MRRTRRTCLFLGLLLLAAGCAGMQPLPDSASTDAPGEAGGIVVLPEYPTPGKKYLAERDGQREIWVVKDAQGTLEFVDESSQQVKLSIKLGPCFSFAVLRRPGGRSTHDFGAMGNPAYHTVPPDCKVWNGRAWTQTYAVQMPTLPQPCYYGARRKAKVEGLPGRRLITSDSSVEITGPGAQRGEHALYQIVWSEEIGFFKELSPGYIGRKAIIIRELR